MTTSTESSPLGSGRNISSYRRTPPRFVARTLFDRNRRLIFRQMPTLDLTDDEQAALTTLVRKAIVEDPYPYAPRLATLKAALAKLDPKGTSTPPLERPPLPQAPMRSRGGRQVRR